MTLNAAHATRIAAAIAQVNAAAASGMSPLADCMSVLDAVSALQADLRGILEAERRRGLLAVTN